MAGGGVGKKVDKEIIPEAPFSNKASPDARVRPFKTWMKTTNMEFESQFSYERLHVSSLLCDRIEELAGRYASRISHLFHLCSFISARVGLWVNCDGVAGCEQLRRLSRP